MTPKDIMDEAAPAQINSDLTEQMIQETKQQLELRMQLYRCKLLKGKKEKRKMLKRLLNRPSPPVMWGHPLTVHLFGLQSTRMVSTFKNVLFDYCAILDDVNGSW